MSSPDLVICVRCHKDPTLITDSVDSVRYYTSPETTQVMCAVDGIPELAERLSEGCHIPTYCSDRRWGWGAGLYTLLLEAIEWSEQRFGKTHFLSIDYDTLVLGPNVDDYVLGLIDSEDIGLVGKHIPDNPRWKSTFEKEKDRLQMMLGEIPDTYIPGEGVQGGFMCLTQSLISRMKSNGFFENPLRVAKGYTSIADDHFISLVCRVLGLRIVHGGNVFCCSWKPSRDPRGAEREGVLVFHPIKMGNAFDHRNRQTEMEMRNYFRKIRGREPLK